MLYRFGSFNSLNLDAVANGSFYFSQRDQVNDPLDCNPPVKFPTYGEFKYRLNKLLSELNDCSPEFIDLFKNEEVIEATYSPFRDSRRLIELLKNQADRVGILCFTKDYNHPLMWSHYSDGHRGFCIGYDIDYDTNQLWGELDLFGGERVFVRDVNYSSEPIDALTIYITLLHFMLRNARDKNGYLNFDDAYKVLGFENISRVIFSHLSIFFLSHKHESWRYENEVRLLAMPFDNKDRSGVKVSSSKILKRVYFGAKMPESQKITLSKLLASETTEFFESRFSEEKLGVIFSPACYI